jgi:dephospho-CoA kinase
MKIVLAICGKAGSGKDAFASTLIEKGFVPIKFASTLKNVIRTLFPSMNTVSHTDGALKDVVDTGVGASPRQLMQFIGTDLLQLRLQEKFPSIGRNIFCAPVVDKIKSIDYSIITDLRFLHEYTALATAVAERKAILYVVRIERTLAIGTDDVHSSENDYMSIPTDFVIHNNASLESLKERAKYVHRCVIPFI